MAAFELRTASLDVDGAEVAHLADLLDAEERDRAARFRFEEGRRRFVVRRARLRMWLGETMGVAPDALRFDAGPHGKPSVVGGPCFSASHSGERMLAAFADREIGCDIERVDEALDWRPLADRFFAPGERAALADAPDCRPFFACWARKEAYVKALGFGLSHPLEGFTVSTGPEPALILAEPGWILAPGPDMPGYASAVVVRAG